MRFHGMTGKLTRFRVVLNAFRGPHCRLQPPHLHRWFCASAASLQQGPTWLHSVSALSVPSADPWGCALVRLASLAGLGPAPLHFAAFCLPMLSRAGPGGAPMLPPTTPPPAPRGPPLLRAHQSASGSLGAAMPVLPTPRGTGRVEVSVPWPSQMCLADILGPTSGLPGPRGGSPHQNLGAEREVSLGLTMGRVGPTAWGDRPPPFSPRGVSLPPTFTPHRVCQVPCAFLGFPGVQ